MVAACEEALVQLDVDDSELARDVSVLISEANLKVTFAVLKVLDGEFDEAASATLTNELLDLETQVDELLG